LSDQILLLLDLLGHWPERLVAKPDRALVEDSLVLLDFLGDARTVVDVGSGGGLPGLPLKLERPDLEMTLIEANHRKAAFLVHAAAQLGLGDVHVVAVRAEIAGHDPRFREQFDAAVVRAVGQLAVIAELCLPLVHVGGRLLAQKTAADDEVRAAAAAIELMGGELEQLAPARSAARAHGQVVVIRKARPTPPEYPRRPGIPERKPILGKTTRG
jgi:16S rRNA (guanine527-N7)-methyltransferase